MVDKNDRGEDNNGSALLYGIFALVVTLIVAAGLFFGGRAVYRALTGSGDSTSTETTQQEEQTGSDEETENTEGTNGLQGQTPGVSSESNGSEGTEEGQAGENGSSGNIPSTGDSDLPQTGSPRGM